MKPKAERNAAASATAAAEAVQKAEQVLAMHSTENDSSCDGPADKAEPEKEKETVASLLSLLKAAKARLAEEALEQVGMLCLIFGPTYKLICHMHIKDECHVSPSPYLKREFDFRKETEIWCK